jgi:hypothetical protein
VVGGPDGGVEARGTHPPPAPRSAPPPRRAAHAACSMRHALTRTRVSQRRQRARAKPLAGEGARESCTARERAGGTPSSPQVISANNTGGRPEPAATPPHTQHTLTPSLSLFFAFPLPFSKHNRADWTEPTGPALPQAPLSHFVVSFRCPSALKDSSLAPSLDVAPRPRSLHLALPDLSSLHTKG